MKKCIRIIIPVVIFVAFSAFILLYPDGDADTPKHNCDKGIHNYTVENLCSRCGVAWKYTEGLEFSVVNDKFCMVSGIGTATAEDIVIPYGYKGLPVVYIGANAFEYNKTIKSVKLPDCIKSIGSYSFYYCASLEKINIPRSVRGISLRAFEGCSSLKIADFSVYDWYETDDGITRQISASIFKDELSSAKKLTDTVDWEYMFNKSSPGSGSACNADEHIYNYLNFCDICQQKWEYTEGVQCMQVWQSKGYRVYRISGNPTDVVVPYAYEGEFVVQIDDNVFNGQKHIKTILLPDTIESIGEYVFAGTSITEMVLPPKLTRVSKYLFKGCPVLTEVYIPKNVTRIDPMAFNNCTALTKVIFADPTGWEIIGYDQKTDMLSDPEKAAQLLIGDAGYYPWVKNGAE